MIHRLLRCLVLAGLVALPGIAAAAKATAAPRCYRAVDPVSCLVSAAKTKLAQVNNSDDRADAIGEMLYALAATGQRDEALAQEALGLADKRAVRPVKQMDLLYAFDIYASAGDAATSEHYVAALRRFAALEQSLSGNALVELYINACSIIAWDGPFRERWLDFAQSVCTPDKLRATKPEGAGHRALVLTMMPVAMTLSEDRDGFAQTADQALSWLRGADMLAAKSGNAAEKDFLAYVGVLMHTMNALCLDAFEEPDAADDEIDAATKLLRRQEMRVGISNRSTFLRRQVVDALFTTGRQADAKKMLKQMVERVDADPKGKAIAFPEQVAILLQAAKIEHDERMDRQNTCVPEDRIET